MTFYTILSAIGFALLSSIATMLLGYILCRIFSREFKNDADHIIVCLTNAWIFAIILNAVQFAIIMKISR